MSEQEQSSATASVKRWIADHPAAAFLLMLYPLEWILFVPTLLGMSGFGVIPVDIPYMVPLGLIALTGLLGLNFLVTRIADGKAGTRALRRHYLHFRVAPQWYLGAIFGPPVMLLMAGLLTHGTGVLTPIAHNVAKIPTVYLLALLPTVVFANFWEEGAWTAFMTSRLQKRIGPVWASLLVAPCFGFVHIPLLFVLGGLMSTGRPTVAQYPFYLFVLLIGFSAQVRILCTWFFNSTGGSVPITALFHGAMDVTVSAAVLSTFYPLLGDGSVLYIGFAVIAVALIALTRGRLGYPPSRLPRLNPPGSPATVGAVAKES
jgi:uncharacterized protein